MFAFWPVCATCGPFRRGDFGLGGADCLGMMVVGF